MSRSGYVHEGYRQTLMQRSFYIFDFVPNTCSRLLRAPFVCNGCPSKAGCRKEKFFYRATAANRDYRSVLVESREGINATETDLMIQKVFLTLYLRSCKCLLIFLLPDKSAASVKAVFDRLEKKLGTFIFCSIFQVILTDRGTEFSNPDALETGIDNVIRTSIYYCDPMCAWQKPGVEKSHEHIRYVLPKGSSFDALTQWDVNKLMNHINSSVRASLNGLPPIRLAQLLLDQATYNSFNFREISPDDIILTPDLLKLTFNEKPRIIIVHNNISDEWNLPFHSTYA